MSIESIQFTLRERFAAPLPEFYQRRIIFWQDEDREFEAMLDELYIPDVTIIKLTGTNNFAVKKMLLHDDLTGNYLIYNPFSYADPKDNWLLDIEKFSEEYRSDLISTRMNELNIEASPAMRKTVKLYAKFFDSKERIERLKRIGREYHTPLQLHIDIMAVLAGLNGGSAQDVFIAVLSEGQGEENNAVLSNIKKFGNIDAFWQLVRKYTGYIHEDEKALVLFAAHAGFFCGHGAQLFSVVIYDLADCLCSCVCLFLSCECELCLCGLGPCDQFFHCHVRFLLGNVFCDIF